MRDEQLMTASMFMQSYDRDVLDLQDDPMSYIAELEGDLERAFCGGKTIDANGNKQWPVWLLKQITGVSTEVPLWETLELTAI